MHLRDGIQTRVTVAQRYAHLVDRGELSRDPAQVSLAQALDRLIDEISAKRLSAKSSSLGWLFAKRRETQAPVRGLYIHGGVGRGKTMLMDMFFELVPVRRKRRVHFNDFMADVHDRINRHRQALKRGEVREDDPIPPVARALAEEAWVLCFDEFAVSDIADAMILSRLFSALFASGVVLVATSNVAPDDLYRDGLNRPLFEPFIRTLKQHAAIFALDAAKDYRLEMLSGMPVYLTPAGPATDRQMDAAWKAMTHGTRTAPSEIVVKGRHVRRAARCRQGCAIFLPRSLRNAARRPRLPGDRRPLRHDLPRPYPGPGRRKSQRGQAPHPADRHALRPRHPAGRQRRGAAGRALCRQEPARKPSSSNAPRRG